MTKTLTEVRFCFPAVSSNIRDSAKFSKVLIKSLQKDGSIEYAGYLEDNDLENDLRVRIGKFNSITYRVPTLSEQNAIQKTICQTIDRFLKVLPHPNYPIYVFVFPWFPEKDDRNAFGGIDAVAVHENVMHLFVSLDLFTKSSLVETVAHEYNHLIFYAFQNSKKYTLLEHMIMEGLAENFREETIGGAPAPWSISLSKLQAHKIFRSLTLEGLLQSKNAKLHKNVLFGNSQFPLWTGYSVGYWLAKSFRDKHPNISWTDLMNTKAEKIASIK